MTSILSDTFAPPRIATNGRSGSLERLAEVAAAPSPSAARPPASRHSAHDRLDRRVRAVRGAERVVHVDVGERRERLRERRRRSSLPRHGSAGSRAARRRRRRARRRPRARPPSPTQSSANATGAPEQLAEPRGHRLQADLGIRLALRPSQMRREDHARSRRRRARTESSAATRGCACRRRSRRS